ncbi:MAG: J domain-containing protein [Myxococcaceae bacterium]|nr:J domain-containing protein [Myxococcaceae bacterium]
MIHVLYIADRQVKPKLFALVGAARKLLLVAGVPPYQSGAANLRELQPFATFEKDFGDALEQVLVVDEGKVEGMWRDPMGDLGEALYPGNASAAATVARGYCLIDRGQPVAAVKRYGTPKEDEWFLLDALSSCLPGVPRPHLSQRPGKNPKRSKSVPPPKPTTPPLRVSPYQVLGVKPGCTLAEAKKAYRALLVQYHPDKVAHLAEEFKALAETRTHDITQAWQAVQRELK